VGQKENFNNRMKYLKLFEYWINEEEEVKFDKANPDVTPILKLTQSHLYGVQPKDTEPVLKSILNKSFNSIETSERPLTDVKVFGYYHLLEFRNGGIKLTNEKMPNREFLVKTPNYDRYKVEEEFNKIPLDLDDPNARVYVVSPTTFSDTNIFWKSVEFEGISTFEACVIILPPTPKNIQGYAIDAPVIIITNGKPVYVTIGQIVTFASKKFTKENFQNLLKPETGKRDYLMTNIFKSDTTKVGGPPV
jgi:hypothetical protein